MPKRRSQVRYSCQNELNRRGFLWLAGLGALGVSVYAPGREPSQEGAGVTPVIHLELDSGRAAVLFLSWDTEGGDRARTNLLRAKSPLVLRARIGNQWYSSGNVQASRQDAGGGRTLFRLALAANVELVWTIDQAPDRLTMTVAGKGSGLHNVEAVEMLFPFDPQVTPTAMIPQAWGEENCGMLPAVISSPDF